MLLSYLQESKLLSRVYNSTQKTAVCNTFVCAYKYLYGYMHTQF